MNTVLVTGATGFIGRHALDRLIARGFEVHAVSSRRPLSETADVTWHVADLLQPEAVRALLNSVRPSHLLHFAWSVTPAGAPTPDPNFRWVQATLELARDFAAVGGRRAVLAGSCAEYDWRYGYCVENLTPLVPRSYYGVCKNASRSVCDGYFSALRVSFSWARIFFVYGPYEPLPRLVPSIVSSLNSRAIAKCTHGEQFRDYLHVDDVADACVALLDTDVNGPINIASGHAVRLRDIAEHIARRLNGEELLKLGALPVAPDDPPLIVGDVRRLTSEVGWTPRYTIAAGLDQTVDWWAARLKTAGVVGCVS